MLRIGELARRAGVSTDLLRAWERRYALLDPTRSEEGFRLYDEADVQRVVRMRAHLEAGVSAAEAARLAKEEGTARGLPGADDLLDALLAFDEVGAHAVLDSLLGSLTLDAVLRDAVMPAMRAVGERWLAGDATIAQEHFASSVVGGRLLGLARGWDRGSGPRAILALPPGERHEFGLIVFGLALRSQGWRITYLGPDTPTETMSETAMRLAPAIVVVSAVHPDRLVDVEQGLRAVAAGARLVVGGPGAGAAFAERIGAELLAGDPIRAAELVATAG